MLKRHLKTAYGMTPEQYRQKWGLPASYPMAAPNYALKRSTLAKSIGLGRKPRQPEPTPAAADHAEPASKAAAPTAESVFKNFTEGGSETAAAMVETVAAPALKPKKAAAAKQATAAKKMTRQPAGKPKGR